MCDNGVFTPISIQLTHVEGLDSRFRGNDELLPRISHTPSKPESTDRRRQIGVLRRLGGASLNLG